MVKKVKGLINRLFAGAVLMCMVLVQMPALNVSADEAESGTSVYVLESCSLEAFAQGAKADGDIVKAGTDNYFSIIYSAKSKVDSSSKTFSDEYASSQRINFGGKLDTAKNAVKFTTTVAGATVKIWWVAGDANRPMGLMDESKNIVCETSESVAKNATAISTLTVETPGTYFLGGTVNNNYIFKIEVTDGVPSLPERKAFSEVSKPTLSAYSVDGGLIKATINGVVGYDGADELIFSIKNASGEVIKSVSTQAEKEVHEMSLEPLASGKYYLHATLKRGEDTLELEDDALVDFVLPLETPVISLVENKGNNTVTVSLAKAVPEAEEYYFYIDDDGNVYATSTGLEAVISNVTAGTHTFKVKAIRGSESSEFGTYEAEVTEDATTAWGFSVYGTSTNTKDNEAYVDGDKVVVRSQSGKGKIVPNSTDGLAFYYTKIDASKNFSLKAHIYLDQWTISNGQEGFGLMVSDTIGVNGSTATVWNNSIMALGSKVEYFYDLSTGEVTADTTKAKISMKLGLGVLTRLGVTSEDVSRINAGEITMPENFSTQTVPLEWTCGSRGTGTYNIFGNYASEPTGTVGNITELVLKITRDNTGYLVEYFDSTDTQLISSQRIFDVERTALTSIDSENIYAGFFAARNAKISVSNIEFESHEPSLDPEAEIQQIEYINTVCVVESAATANDTNYDFVFVANADGKLTLADKSGASFASDVQVTANTKTHIPVTLNPGSNDFVALFTPDSNYKPSEFVALADYSEVTLYHTVTLNTLAGENNYIYVSPEGKSTATGTRDNPVDIYTAVKYAHAGQTIVLQGGEYSLNKTVVVERGINGTPDSKIFMVGDTSTTRPVLNFNGKCAGMVIAGDYWYFKDFDVTGSADAQKGIQVSGSYNTLDQINAYKNGNTGIQISRYKSTDTYENWPSDNLILNCTSYLNADKGYEDADGFAAKLTIAGGNVFDGCISYLNADDGWDLYAKVETGSIGSVLIKDCVAFYNGYYLDSNGELKPAGNGNGFKMGGESLPGNHVLQNSLAFLNRAKGIDSNSCPDINAYNSISFENGSYNVALYTNNAINTDYAVAALISYRKNTSGNENIKPKGSQDNAHIYHNSAYYFEGSTSKNASGREVTDDWFVSLDFDMSKVGRNADGTINMNGFLELTSKAALFGKCGLSTGTASAIITLPANLPNQSQTDTGNNNNNANTSLAGQGDANTSNNETATASDGSTLTSQGNRTTSQRTGTGTGAATARVTTAPTQTPEAEPEADEPSTEATTAIATPKPEKESEAAITNPSTEPERIETPESTSEDSLLEIEDDDVALAPVITGKKKAPVGLILAITGGAAIIVVLAYFLILRKKMMSKED